MKSSGPTRLFFATDLHASERAFRKFVNAAKFYNVNVLVLGGDVVGKMVVPIIDLGGGRFRAEYGDQTHIVESQAALTQLQERLGLIGAYFQVMSPDEYQNLAHDSKAVHNLFQQLARERLSKWMEFAQDRLQGTGIRCFVMGGNDDAPEILQVMDDAASDVIVPCEGRVVHLDEQHSMISLGYSTPTPWHTPREISEAVMSEKIEAMLAQVADSSHCVFNLHDPPINSSLDVCAQVAEGNPPRIVLNGGKPVMHNAGSTAVRGAIEKYQPILSLHGHIHESRGTKRIGRTLCVNPGSEYAEGILRGVIVTLKDGKLQGHQLTAG